ncbi:MAG: SPOR domain-containing protein [Bdellovibrio sp. CG10_big_fil_rev_8_21_14_0_10_47_8]|nr:MAG: SPOR domain-containing protein [Bdellovibrio sp. CG10_big_fil_rev_8_21_14_0_10_47_8]
MTTERYGSKTDVIVKLVLVFFIALLSFSIGTFVGKKFSDNQHKMAQLEPGEEHGEDSHTEAVADSIAEDHLARDIASVHPDTEIRPEKALSDDEIAKLAEEFVTDDESDTKNGHMTDKNNDGHTEAKAEHAAESAHGEEHAAVHPTQKPSEKAKTEVKSEHPTAAKHDALAEQAHEAVALKPAERMAHGKEALAENPPHKASRIPSSLPKEIAASALGKYTVQVSAYPTEKEAQTKAAELKDKGFSSFYVSAKVKDKTWYRVSVGLFTTQKEAEAYMKDLKSRAKVSSAIVQKVTSAE